MKETWKGVLNRDYHKAYEAYKKLPLTLMFETWFTMLIWSIIDVTVFNVTTTNYYYSHTSYGVMGLDSAFLALLIWWAIGAALGFFVYTTTVSVIAPKVVQIDAILNIEKAVCGKGKTENPSKKAQPNKKQAKATNNDNEIIVRCPSCDETLSFDRETLNVGDKVECPYCDHSFVLKP